MDRTIISAFSKCDKLRDAQLNLSTVERISQY